jgi:ribonuclease VapC
VIVDASALIAVLLREPDHRRLMAHLQTGSPAAIGAPTLVETGMVITARLGTPGISLLDRLVREAEITVIPFASQHWPVAIDAFSRFGKGRHRAALNFGDCLTYAVASVAGEPLLHVGDDFPLTDLALVT